MVRWVTVAAVAATGWAIGLLSGYGIAAEHAKGGHLTCDC